MSLTSSRSISMPLLLSLLLNAVLIGFLLAQGLHGMRSTGVDRPPAAGLPSLKRLAANMDAPSRTALREVFRAHQEPIRDRLRKSRVSRREVALALRAEPFDAAALDAAFTRQREADQAVAAAIQAVLLEFAGQQDAPSRRALLRALANSTLRPARGPAADRDAPPNDPSLR